MKIFRNINKNIKISICIIIIIALIIYYLPIPKYINTTLQGVQLIDDTITDNNVTITIKGWQINYLFHYNKFKGTLTITPYHFEETNNATFDFLGDILVPSDGM